MTAIAYPGPQTMTPFAGATPTGAIATSIGSDVTFTFNAAGDKVAILFQASTTTVPDLVAFNVASVTGAGTAGTIDATLEVVTNGVPAGAVTNSATGSATISTIGNKTIAGMAGTATVTVGTMYAVVLTAGAGWDRNLALRTTTGSSQGFYGFPTLLTKDTAGAYTVNTGSNTGWQFSLADSGGVYLQIPGIWGPHGAAFQAFGSATNPDERGNRWVQGTPQTIIGAYLMYQGGSTPDANDDYSVNLYTNHTTSPSQVATSGTMEGEAQGGVTMHIALFATPYDIAAGTTVALALRAVGTGSANLIRWDFPSNAALGAIFGTGFFVTTANDGGAFSDADTDSMYSIWPMFSKGSDGTGAGGMLYVPNMDGA